ncbi:MAG TPA: hypothetical protein VIO61_08155 [Anaerolineaceae bacterium]
MPKAYIPHNQSAHGLAEEQQWARLAASGEPVKGMIVIFLQKMCSVFHEFEPAWKAGALNPESLPYFRERLSRRVNSVLTAMENNGLQEIAGYTDLQNLMQAAATAPSMQTLADLAEPVHQANHKVTDALESS